MNRELGKLRKRRRERNPKEITSSCSFAPLRLATMACSSAPSLSVLAALLLSLGIALVLPHLVVCVATMTHSKGPQNFDPSLSIPTLTYEYDVFVSFRGADTLSSFNAYLFSALDRKRIVAFRDDLNLPRGAEIGPELLKAIETSRIAVVVFSKSYATSGWCLDELVKIMECKRLLNQIVLPIFYHVSPSMVRKEILNGPKEKVNIWKAALTNVSSLAGMHLKPYRLEPEFVEETAKIIQKILYERNPKETTSSCSLAPLHERNPKETTSSCSLAPLRLATMARSSGPSLLVLAALLLCLGIVLVLRQLVVCVATMTHFKGPKNFNPSLSTPTLTYEYDVFVSFCGADTRTSFTAFLYAALDRRRIVAYKDDRNLPRGEEIRPELFKAIETSRIAVVVLSKNYATSDWCLDELVKIMECRRLLNQRVLPIFYHVSPSMVRKELGNRAKAILNGPKEKVNIWKAALTNVSNLAGMPLKPYR